MTVGSLAYSRAAGLLVRRDCTATPARRQAACASAAPAADLSRQVTQPSATRLYLLGHYHSKYESPISNIVTDWIHSQVATAPALQNNIGPAPVPPPPEPYQVESVAEQLSFAW